MKIIFCIILALALSLTAFCAEEVIFDFGKESDGLFGYSAYEIENISYDGTAVVYTNKTPGNSGLRGTPLSSLDINGTDYAKIEVRYKVENTVNTNGTSSLLYFQQLDRENDSQKVSLWSSVFSASVPYAATPEYVTQVWNLSQYPALSDNKMGESFFGIGLNSGSAGVKCYIDYIKFIPAAAPGKGITKDENGIVTLDFGLEADEFFGMYGVSISDITYDGEAVIYTNTTERNSGFRGDVLSKYDINGTDYAEIEVRFKVTGIPSSSNSSCMLYCAQQNRETSAVEVSLWAQPLSQAFPASSAGEYMTVKYSLSTYSGIEDRKIGEIFFGTGLGAGASNVKCYIDYIKFIPHDAVEADPVPEPEVVVTDNKPQEETITVEETTAEPIQVENLEARVAERATIEDIEARVAERATIEDIEVEQAITLDETYIDRAHSLGYIFATFNAPKSFEEKLSLADEDLKCEYREITSTLCRIEKVRATRSFKGETYRCKSKGICKLTIRGKTLNVYLALNPAEFENTKYIYEDVSNKKEYANYPMRVKVTSERQVKWVKELILINAEKNGFTVNKEPITNILDLFSTFKKSKSFNYKLRTASSEVKYRYKEITAHVKSFDRVRVIKGKKGETYKRGNVCICKLTIRGKTLNAYIGLDTKAFEDTKYIFTDASSSKAYANYPMRVKVTSERQVRWVKELITACIDGKGDK